MKAHWWRCVLGLLCMPAEVILSTWTVSQDPASMSETRVNSSVKITCSTSLSNPMGLQLYGLFHSNKVILYLNLNNGQITKSTTAPEFEGRIAIAPDKQIRLGCGFTLRLSLLGLEDSDLYYCSWITLTPSLNIEALNSNGTVIVVRERDPQEQCKYQSLDPILIALSVTAFMAVLFLAMGALLVKCRRFKEDFAPARHVKPTRPIRPEHVCSPPRVHHCPYLITSESTLDFRGIL